MPASSGYVVGGGSSAPANQVLVSGGPGQPATFQGGVGAANAMLTLDAAGAVRWGSRSQRRAAKGLYTFAPVPPPVLPTPPSAPTFSGTVRYVGSVGGDYATVAAAVAAAVAGDIVEVRAGYTSTETGTVTIGKSLEIRGQNRATSVITGPASLTTALLSVSAGVNNVYIHTATIRNNQVPASDGGGLSSCITAATMTQAYPLGSTGLYFYDLTLTTPKMGISVQGAGFVIDNCTFACNTAAPGTTIRNVVNYGQTGNCFFTNCTVTATSDATPRSVIMYLTANNPGAGTFVPGHQGNLVWQNIVENGTCNAYYLQDVLHQPDTRNGGNYQNAPTPGSLGLWFDNCTFNGQWSGNSISFAEATSTTIAAGSNGLSLPQATVNVASASAFPATGTVNVYTSTGYQVVTYTGKTATSFTGCTGGDGVGTMSTGGNVNGLNPLNFFSTIYVNNCTGQKRTTGDEKGFVTVTSSAGSGRLVGAPTVGLYCTGTNTFNSTLPSATYGNASTVASLLGYATANYAAPVPLIAPAVPQTVPSAPQTTTDGVSLVAGDRALVISTNTLYSGVYDVAAGDWTRAIDYAAGMAASGTYLWVQSGTTYGSTLWECSSAPGSDVVGTSLLAFGRVAATENVSAVQTGTQTVAHGLGRTPQNVLVGVSSNATVAGGLFAVSAGVPTSSNVPVTATANTQYRVYTK